MAGLKRRKLRGSGRGHSAPGKGRRQEPQGVVPTALPADGDEAGLAVAPTFEIEAAERNPALEGAVDDWAGMDTVADLVDEPAEGRRRR